MRNSALYRRLWPIGQWAIGAAEAPINVNLTQTHRYRLDWLTNSVHFFIDDQPILISPYSPRGQLGFVAWLDNQYAIVTPQGQFGMGLIAVKQRQWLTLESLTIEPL
jgi:hypothetical protein